VMDRILVASCKAGAENRRGGHIRDMLLWFYKLSLTIFLILQLGVFSASETVTPTCMPQM
jgi:hypothetical protein